MDDTQGREPKRKSPTRKKKVKRVGRSTDDQENRRLIVGIGASAGGLDALKRFFEALPDGRGLTFVVIVHLDPNRESSLAEILQRHTSMTVVQVTDKTQIKPDHVFVIPPNRTLSATDGELKVSTFEEPRGKRAPIDLFFRTLAETHKENAVALILSGGGTDGTVGLRSVKDQGGIVLVQAPEDAEHEGMPRSAIDTGLADLVLPVEALAEKLLQYRKGGWPLPVPKDAERLPAGQDDTLNRLLSLLRARTGQDFSQYKRATVLRRIGRRMRVNQISSFDDYLGFLRSTPAEAHLLQKDLLIGVTHFFRDPAAWLKLEERAIPEILADAGEDQSIRIWVPGCATGEEAYSMAILLAEYITSDELLRLQVFASDLDEQALATGRRGLYPDAIRADVSEERLHRFFHREGDHFRIRRELRDRVLFSAHSLFKDPPFSKLNLISCRNLLIYLNRELQQKVFRLFHYALKPGGYLFLGSAESVEADAGLFEPVDRKHRVYRRLEVTKRLELPSLELSGRPGMDIGSETLDKPRHPAVDEARRHQQVLEENAPPSVLVQRNLELVHLSKSAGRYLMRPGGFPSHDVLQEVRPELRLPLQRALHAAFEEGVGTTSRPVEVRFNGEKGWVHLIVQPRMKDGEKPDVALVIFAEVASILGMDPGDAESGEHPHVQQLEREVQQVHEQLQNTIEEYESSREEMRASNEELQSTAEEYKSTSEELETSKEELQSVNEELETVNQELKNKVEELSQSNSDLQNLMDSTDVETLFLDRELRIQRFTPNLTEIFNIVETDRGRPITDLTHRLEYDHFVDDVRRVLRNLVPFQTEAKRKGDGWYLVRLRPYRTVDERIDGVVAAFVDITALKNAEEGLRAEKEYSDLIVETVRESLLVLNAEFKIILANRSFYEHFQVSPEETVGESVYRFAGGQWNVNEFRDLLEKRLPEEKMVNDFRLEHDFNRIGRRVVLLDARRFDDKQLILLSMEDITQRERAEAELKDLNRTLERKVEQRSREVRKMSQRLAQAAEIEQRRISEVLHDDLQQRVYACRLQVGSLRTQVEQSKRQAALERVEAIDSGLAEILSLTRNLSRTLTPPTIDQELPRAIRWLTEQMKNLYQLQVEIKTGESFQVEDFNHRLLLFQSLRELLFNVAKHSGVKQATVAFARENGGVAISVHDSGCGFDIEEATQKASDGEHLGLLAIRERLKSLGGEMRIASAPGNGTTITIHVPEGVATGWSRP
ncbi:MAG: chemotaxis protein CheB [Acidobacteriota bacterium]